MKQEFKTTEVARIFNVSKITVINWVKNGKLPAYETLGGHRRILREDLIALVKQRELPLPNELKSEEELNPDKYRILIVDDEKNVVESVKFTLDNLGANLEIETAFNGFEAGMKAISFFPHLIILDALMPGAGGDMVIKLIRNNQKLKDIKIMVFTGYSEEGKKLFDLGADKFIEKFSEESNPTPFCKEVCKLLGIKYTKIII